METRQSLLIRLRDPSDNPSWQEFYEMYWQVILRYCRKRGLSEADAQDVLQETMITLIRVLPTFCYNSERGRFRNFLLTIVHRKCARQYGRMKQRSALSLDADLHKSGRALMDSLPAHPALEPGEAEERDWRHAICQRVLDGLVSDGRLEDRSRAIFEAYALQGRPCAEVAEEFGIKQNAVYQIRNRVSRTIKREVELLSGIQRRLHT